VEGDKNEVTELIPDLWFLNFIEYRPNEKDNYYQFKYPPLGFGISCLLLALECGFPSKDLCKLS
jgi:hypothetical protein